MAREPALEPLQRGQLLLEKLLGQRLDREPLLLMQLVKQLTTRLQPQQLPQASLRQPQEQLEKQLTAGRQLLKLLQASLRPPREQLEKQPTAGMPPRQLLRVQHQRQPHWSERTAVNGDIIRLRRQLA